MEITQTAELAFARLQELDTIDGREWNRMPQSKRDEYFRPLCEKVYGEFRPIMTDDDWISFTFVLENENRHTAGRIFDSLEEEMKKAEAEGE